MAQDAVSDNDDCESKGFESDGFRTKGLRVQDLRAKASTPGLQTKTFGQEDSFKDLFIASNILFSDTNF